MAYLHHASQEYVDDKVQTETDARTAAINAAKANLQALIQSEASRASGQEAILQQAINNIKTFEVVLADALPTPSSNCEKKIYLVPSGNPKAKNTKDEYICIQSGGTWTWEQIGSTEITLEYDLQPTDGSSKLVRSGGIYAWVKEEIRKLTSWITDRLNEKLAKTDVVAPSAQAVNGKAASAKGTGEALAGKVDAVSGKGLSSNDYTNDDKAEVGKIPQLPREGIVFDGKMITADGCVYERIADPNGWELVEVSERMRAYVSDSQPVYHDGVTCWIWNIGRPIGSGYADWVSLQDEDVDELELQEDAIEYEWMQQNVRAVKGHRWAKVGRIATASQLPYAINTTSEIKDRSINVLSAASATLPDDFTDLVIRASVSTSLAVTMPSAITTVYGDTFPGEEGEYLVTITKTGAAEAYVRTIKLEVQND